MDDALVCWRCGATLRDVLAPLPRLAECAACHAELHVCRMCVYYEPRVANACREPIADAVLDKTRANFCGYYQVRPNAYVAPNDAAAAARAQLEAMFGNAAPPPVTPDPQRAAVEALFKKPG